MEFLQLKYFQTVAKLESITKAAEELHVSQPSISQTISRLEQELEVALFDRKGRTIQLNPFGKTFLNYVNRLFSELENGTKFIQEMAGLQNQSITIAVTNPYILPSLFRDFKAVSPNTQIKQVHASMDKISDQLDTGEIDLCISTVRLSDQHIQWHELPNEELFLSVSKTNSFAKRKSISLIEAKNEVFIAADKKIGFRSVLEELCNEAGFEPNIGFEIEETGIILKLVEEGLGVALTPTSTIRGFESDRIVHIPIKSPQCQRIIGIAWSKKYKLSEVATDFLNCTINFFNR